MEALWQSHKAKIAVLSNLLAFKKASLPSPPFVSKTL